MDFWKWFIEEHPWLFFFAMMFTAQAIAGLGRIGSKRIKVSVPDDEE
jgi:hypothetical protein